MTPAELIKQSKRSSRLRNSSVQSRTDLCCKEAPFALVGQHVCKVSVCLPHAMTAGQGG